MEYSDINFSQRFVYSFLKIKIIFFKTKRLVNPRENRWSSQSANINVGISCDGLKASNTNEHEWLTFYAEKGFAISGENRRMDDFPGTILYYFEVTTDISSIL